MRVDTRPRKRNAPRPAEKSAPGFLQWLRGRECLAAKDDPPCGGKIEAAHVDYAGDKGMGTKVSDKYAIPLCTHHHSYQHRVGWGIFQWRVFGDTGYALAASQAYWQQWPGRIAWERKQEAGQ